MIGVIAKTHERRAVEEFFELFKTPWEFYCPGQTYQVIIASTEQSSELDAKLVIIYSSATEGAGTTVRRDAILRVEEAELPLYGETRLFETDAQKIICVTSEGRCAGFETITENFSIVRLGYDLFLEIEHLLTIGQPLENAEKPTLELHIAILRKLILKAGLSFIEIPPVPAACDFAVCLSHDIDFVGIRRHKFDHTMWGFLLRATVGALRDFLKGKTSAGRLLASWKAAASLPFVYLGMAKDFWMPFDWYLKVEQGLSPTYFFIPFKGRQGRKVNAENPSRRASGYGIADIPEWIEKLQSAGCEVGVHGIDAWHDPEKGREEQQQVSNVSGRPATGIRMHWLLRDEHTYEVLEQAGYSYDSTSGYNETPGYRCGTVQPFRPLTAKTLIELPMHIQDGALFYAKRLALTEADAWNKCEAFIQNSLRFGGVLTVLWHDRSFAAERFWGDFYIRLVERLKALNVWFVNGSELVSWFRERRAITFERTHYDAGGTRIRINRTGKAMARPFRVKIYQSRLGASLTKTATGSDCSEQSWDGEKDLDIILDQAQDRKNQSELLQTTTIE